MDPDSISRREAVLSFKFRLLERRILNTEAASVEPMTEATRKLSRSGRLNARWINRPVIPAVSRTPIVESRIACLFDVAAEAAVKHDENKADRTDQLTELIIIERYFKDTVYPKAHAQQDKRKKGRDAQFIDETAG